MKRLIYFITTLLLAGCTSFEGGNPYEKALQTLRVQAVYPEGYEQFARSGVVVTALVAAFTVLLTQRKILWRT